MRSRDGAVKTRGALVRSTALSITDSMRMPAAFHALCTLTPVPSGVPARLAGGVNSRSEWRVNAAAAKAFSKFDMVLSMPRVAGVSSYTIFLRR